jgi:excisionase family DNA binding protein
MAGMIYTSEESHSTPPVPPGKPAFLSRREVADLFGVSVSTVTRWARQGLLKTLRTPGGHYRFPAEETRRAAARATLEETRDPANPQGVRGTARSPAEITKTHS